MAKLPCPRCGSPDVVGTFCAVCLRNLHPLIGIIKEPGVTFCVRSGNAKLKGSWESIPVSEAVRKVVEAALRPSAGATIERIEVVAPELDFLQKPGIDRTVEVMVIVTGRTEGATAPYNEEYTIPLQVKTTISEQYAKIGTEYFEGTLQVRNETPEQQRALKELIARYDGVAINKERKVTTGTDYFITDKRVLQAVAHKLHERFGGVLKTNARLFSHDKLRSKDIHRLTMFLAYPDVAPGDVVTDGKDVLLVLHLGKKVQYENLTTGKHTELAYKPGKLRKLELQKTTVSQTEPLAVIDPETFQQAIVRNQPPLALAAGEEVRVVKDGGSIWVARSAPMKQVN